MISKVVNLLYHLRLMLVDAERAISPDLSDQFSISAIDSLEFLKRIINMKILIISQPQYGYLIDYSKYCEYLKYDFDITYLCWDYSYKKIDEPGIKIIYISREGNVIFRNIRFILSIIKYIKDNQFKIIFIGYFRGCSIIPLYFKNIHKIHLDIRTGNISRHYLKRITYNSILRIESKFFKSISIISKGLRKFLGVTKNAIILPLGATPVDINHNIKQKLHLLYIGTFTNRRLENTISGVKLFLLANPKSDIFYTIIGNGSIKETNCLSNIISSLNLQEYIKLMGYVPHKELISYYESANIGISYIPITPYYNYQPPTKTFEYLMAGMPVIATKTSANKEIIIKENGILIEDDAISFADGIKYMYKYYQYFDKNKVTESVNQYEWKLIIQKMKENILL